MRVVFYKYHGNGNDFIIIDNRSGLLFLSQRQIEFICDRHFGIGADGLMFLEEKGGFDFSLRYYNSDGHESSMCGNGGRCMACFAHKLRIIERKARFLAADGIHEAEILSEVDEKSLVRLKMKDTIPGTSHHDGYLIDTGSPHFVKFVPDTDSTDVVAEGRAIRYESRFAPGGCNVNFVHPFEKGIKVRTYERGVEDETLSCGTGVTASALVTAILDPSNPGFFDIETPGGKFKVSFRQEGESFSEIFLEGPAEFVFKGEIII